MASLRVFIGYDQAQEAAYRVAESSLRRRASIPVEVTPLRLDRLRLQGLLRRPMDARGGMYDMQSQAPQATEFAVSRFLVPLLAQGGPALFVDCDVVFLGDVAELLDIADRSKAVQVVKHLHVPTEMTKMVGVQQTVYGRKNWSSVMLFAGAHQANDRLTLDAINNWPGRDLHAFAWLHDDEIGELPGRFNWLVDVQPRPADVVIAHMTLGGDWIPGWAGGSFDEEWRRERDIAKR